MNGPVDLQSLELFADPTTRTTVQLTFDDPSAINKNEPPYNTVEWKDWTSGSTTVDGTPIRDATAVRVTVTEFKVGELGQGHLNVSVAAPEAREGDVLKNTVFGVMNFKIDDEPSPLQKILEEQTNAVTKSIIASETSGQILDVYGAPYEGVRVMVYARGLNGLPVGEPLGEAVTDANGNYAIDNLVSGEYVTVVESQPTDLAALWDYDDAVAGTERPTADPTLTCNDEVATTETPDRAGFTVGVDTEQPNVDFIYGPIPCIDLEKTASLQVVGVAGTPIDYTFTATNTGTVELSDVEITDDLLPEGTEITYTWPNPD